MSDYEDQATRQAHEEISDRREEVERLRAKVATADVMYRKRVAEVERLREEIKRLREALEDIGRVSRWTDAVLVAHNALRGAPWKGDEAAMGTNRVDE